MRRYNLILLVSAVVLTLGSFTPNFLLEKNSDKGQKYLLKYDPKTGTSGTMIMDYSMKINMDLMGQSMEMDQKMEMGAKMEVVENTANEVITNMAYEFFAMSMTNPMIGVMAYDSRKTDNEGMLATELEGAFKEILGQKINITQDKTGRTVKTEGMDQVMGMNKSQGSLDFSSVMGMSQFPENPVKVGESWTNIMDDESSPMRMEAKMTLTKVRDGKVFVAFESDVSSNAKFDMNKAMEGTDSEGEEAPDLDINGTQSGTFVYEQANMWLIEGMIQQDLSMTVEQMGMEIPMKLKGDMILVME